MDTAWKSSEKEVKAACHLLNESIYKRQSVKWRKESECREYASGNFYSCQDLYRDAHVKGLSCFISEESKTRGLISTPVNIKLGELVFVLAKIDCTKQHCLYKLAENS